MPVRVNNAVSASGISYGRPFVGEVEDFAQIAINAAALTTREVDSDGYLKPGVPFQESGALITAAGQYVYGVSIEPIKVANSNAAADLTAAGSVQIGLATTGQVNRYVIEDNLGAVLNANELAAFFAAGCLIRLLR